MPEVPPVSRTSGLAAEVTATFDTGGPLQRALTGFEPRESQRQMAVAVADVFESGGILLAEGGTGTGKTLAYLVPAILSRTRVLISTGTKNLQEQIFFKDIPLLRDALDVPFTATYMKGRVNYLCIHRFAAMKAEADLRTPEDQSYLADLTAWAASTDTGDRAELDDLPDDLPFWNEIAATSENCLGMECPEYDDCHVTRMRRRASESDLVIVNHHLLCADAAVRQSSFGEVIPECHWCVIDEAHQLEDVATQYFGVAVSTYRLDELVRDGERLLGTGTISDLESRTKLARLLATVQQRGHGLFDALSKLREPGRRDDRIRVDAQHLEPCAGLGAELSGSLESVESAIGLVKDASDDLLSIGRRAGEIRDQLRFLLNASDADFVYFLETRGRGVFLRAAPIDVSAIVSELLLDRMRATILTSATLTVEQSFSYIRDRLGIREAHELRLNTEFDYATQTLLYLPRNMPDPRDPAFCRALSHEVLEVLRRSAGRAFVLFTSYANLREVHALIESALDYPLYVQGTAPRSALLRDFRDTPHAVLLATSSFWQGVDVVGEALSCVIIDKLPFASPSDPITAARIEAIAARGDEPFHDYQVPLATLTLLQGLGRLIRHRSDRGVLAILDPRLRTKGYGSRFLASLPPAPVTHALQDISDFFGSPESAGHEPGDPTEVPGPRS